MSETGKGKDELDVMIDVSNKMQAELQAVIKKYQAHPKMSTYCVLGGIAAALVGFCAREIIQVNVVEDDDEGEETSGGP